ncbi:MAG: YqgE/AlgH family protein [Thermoanaerobaculia bacterium]
MTEPTVHIEAPALLVAMPQVVDPYFHKSVIFLLRHSDEGSIGLIVNRPTEVTVEKVLSGMSIAWQGSDRDVTWFGGPVMPQLGSVLFAPDPPLDGARQPGVDEEATVVAVGHGIRMTHHVGQLVELAAAPPEAFRLFLGYAGWGPGQLMEEILRNDWVPAPLDRELVFAQAPEESWEAALRSIGMDSAALPSWTRGGGDASTN